MARKRMTLTEAGTGVRDGLAAGWLGSLLIQSISTLPVWRLVAGLAALAFTAVAYRALRRKRTERGQIDV